MEKIVKATKRLKKQYIEIAMELKYPPAIIEDINKCKTEADISRVMTTYRKRLK